MNNLFKTLSVIAISTVYFSITGCEEAELPIPLENKPTSQQPSPNLPVPADKVPTFPDSSGVSDPGNPSAPPAADPSGPSIPVVPGLLKKIIWAALDYKEFRYNSRGDLLHYVTQYNSVQGTSIVRRDEYTYTYDGNGNIVSISNKDGIRTEYFYSGDVWSEALSFDKFNRPLRKYKFQFNAKKQLADYAEFNVSLDGAITPRSKTNFSYDGAGNLTHYTYFWYVESSKTFVRSTELQFSNFDSKKYAKNSTTFDYILQPLSFFVNNPGKKETLSSSNPIEYYTYSYDQYSYPTHRTTSYSYDKPLPETKATFEY
ncbi:hypothetical protein [Daejeonella lutea]|uniref:YD repeat-containing protein n=1 Tax=Daejeonella lutea TaxID=572036 RepID=A0A1T5A582_9SPHI|nr:hypothetical protein [Daejeonella lutea]SKB30106.1 YD repeat-containing protein [Daejeonella lutea]